MTQDRLLTSAVSLMILCGAGMLTIPLFQSTVDANPAAPQAASAPASTSKAKTAEGQKNLAEESAAIEIKRQQLVERESALAAKDQELKKASAGLDAKLKELAELKKAFDEAMKQKKTEAVARQERYKKMLKIYKGLKPAEAGKLIDNLEDELAIEMLNQMDQKTAIKLIPFLNQPRVLKWTRLNLKGTEQ